jgi:hypothetical protein
LPVVHATDCAGLPLLLVRRGSSLDAALRSPDARMALHVEDVPPLECGPHLGRAGIAGRAKPGAGAAMAEVVLEFADANPVPELFDVGGDMELYVIEPEYVRLERSGTVVSVDVGDYMAADPDPLHEYERDLLVDLTDHHRAEIEAYFRQQLIAARVDWITTPSPVRLDRYGFILDVGLSEHARPRWVRLCFTRPVVDRHELAHLLHPVLFHSGR